MPEERHSIEIPIEQFVEECSRVAREYSTQEFAVFRFSKKKFIAFIHNFPEIGKGDSQREVFPEVLANHFSYHRLVRGSVYAGRPATLVLNQRTVTISWLNRH